MASIGNSTAVSVLKIKEFRGLNQNPDGDTSIQNGELAEMRNFRITRDRHLQVRPRKPCCSCAPPGTNGRPATPPP